MKSTEHQDQCAFVSWFRTAHRGVLIFAIPNGAHLSGAGPVRLAPEVRRAIAADKLKAEGLLPGVPDLCIPAWGPLWVEMKVARGGRLSPAQVAVHEALRAAGQAVVAARGYDDAVAQVTALRPADWRERRAS